MKVLVVSSEIVPFAKTGGLADVSGALPKALRRIGVEADCVLECKMASGATGRTGCAGASGHRIIAGSMKKNLHPEYHEVLVHCACGETWTIAERRKAPRTIVHAQFSIPWGVGTALVKRRVGLGDYTDHAIRNREILEVTAKMLVEVDNTLHKPGPAPTRVKVITTDGRTAAKIVENPLGSLERPMSFEDCARKFADCAKSLDARRIDRIIQMVGELERLENIQEIISLLT